MLSLCFSCISTEFNKKTFVAVDGWKCTDIKTMYPYLENVYDILYILKYYSLYSSLFLVKKYYYAALSNIVNQVIKIMTN